MKIEKPRVIIDTNATFANVFWNSIPRASYYTVKYALNDAPSTIINTLNVTSSSVILTSLIPETNYIVYVTTTVMMAQSQCTTIKFSTTSLNIMNNIGAGDSLYPTNFSDKYNLKNTPSGYGFNPNTDSLYCNNDFYQFCVFDLGTISCKTNLTLKLEGTTGNWSICPNKTCYLLNTILQLKLQTITGWMNANKSKIPGVVDIEDGARIFDRATENSNEIRVTLSNIPLSKYTCKCYVRVGIINDNRNISGISLVKDLKTTYTEDS